MKRNLVALALVLFSVFLAIADVNTAPVIYYTDITQGPKVGNIGNSGAYISIYGKGFGNGRGSSTVTIGGVPVSNYIFWSTAGNPGAVTNSANGIQQIVVQPGATTPVGSGQAIVVTVGGVASNSDKTFTVINQDATHANIFWVGSTGDTSHCTIATNSSVTPCSDPQRIINSAAFDNGSQMIVMGPSMPATGLQNCNTNKHPTCWAEFRHSALPTDRPPSGGIIHNVSIVGNPGTSQPTINRHINGYCGAGCQNDTNVISNLNISTDDNYVAVSLQDCNGCRVINNSTTGMNVNCTTFPSDCGGSGDINMFGSNNKIWGNYCHDNTGATNLYHCLYSSDDDGLHPTGIDFGWNHISHEGGGRGIQIYDTNDASGQSSFTNITVHDNVIHDIALDGITFGANTKTGMSAYNNVVYNTGQVSPGGGCIRADDLDGVHSRSGTLVLTAYQNTLYNCGVTKIADSGGFRLNNFLTVTLTNNITLQVASGSPLCVDANDPCEHYINKSNYNVASGTVTASHNDWFGIGAINTSLSETTPFYVDPKFISTSTPDFHLQSTSPMIGNGVTTAATTDLDGNARPQTGCANFDIGAYQFVQTCGGTTTTTTSTTTTTVTTTTTSTTSTTVSRQNAYQFDYLNVVNDITFSPTLFANLGTGTNGMEKYCSDCKNILDDSVSAGSQAVGSGHGSHVAWTNGKWRIMY